MASFGFGPEDQLLRHREAPCLSPSKKDGNTLCASHTTPLLVSTTFTGSNRLHTVRDPETAMRIALHPGAGALAPVEDYVKIANSHTSPQAHMSPGHAPSTPTRRAVDLMEPHLASPALSSPSSTSGFGRNVGSTPMKSARLPQQVQKSASYAGSPKRPHTARTERCLDLSMSTLPNGSGLDFTPSLRSIHSPVKGAPHTMLADGITQREQIKLNLLTKNALLGIPSQKRGEALGAPCLLPQSKHPYQPRSTEASHAKSLHRMRNEGLLPTNLPQPGLGGGPSISDSLGSPLRKSSSLSSFSGSASPSSTRGVHNHLDWSKQVEIQSLLKHAGGLHKEMCQWNPSPAHSPKARNGMRVAPATPASWA